MFLFSDYQYWPPQLLISERIADPASKNRVLLQEGLKHKGVKYHTGGTKLLQASAGEAANSHAPSILLKDLQIMPVGSGTDNSCRHDDDIIIGMLMYVMWCYTLLACAVLANEDEPPGSHMAHHLLVLQ